MKRQREQPSSIIGLFLVGGLLFGLGSWFLDAAVLAGLLHQGDFVTLAVSPGANVVWIRTFTAGLFVLFAGVVGLLAVRYWRAKEDLAQQRTRLATILEINKRIAYHTDAADLLSFITEEAARLVRADGASVRLLRNGRLVLVGKTPGGLILEDVPALSIEGVVGRSVRENRMIVVPDVQQHPDIPPAYKTWAATKGLYALVSLPIQSRQGVVGALSIAVRFPRGFTDDELETLTAFAAQASIALENAQVLAELKAYATKLELANTALQDEITERNEVEAALRMGHERYHDLFEHVPVALWEEDFSGVKTYLEELRSQGVTDFHTYFAHHPDAIKRCISLVRVLDVNIGTLEIYQLPHKQSLLGPLRLFSDTSYTMFAEEICVLATGSKRFEAKYLTRKMNSSPMHVFLRVTLAPGHEATWSRVLVSMVEITALKQAEQALQESESRYRTLVEKSLQGISITRNGVRLFANPALATILGYDSPEELVGQKVQNNVAPHEHQRLEDYRSTRFLRELAPVYYQYQAVKKDGTLIWIENTAAVIPWDGEPAILTTLVDITARKQAEEELRLRALELEALVSIAHILATPGTFQDKASTMLQTMQTLGQGDMATLRMPSPHHRGLPTTAHSGPGTLETEPVLLLSSDQSVSVLAYEHGEAVIVHDYATHPHAVPSVVAKGVQSVAVFPLKVGNQTLGVVSLTAVVKNHFTPERLRLLTAIAEGIGTLVDNARLLAETVRHQTRLTSVLEINKRLAVADRLETLLARITEEATHLIHADGACIFVRRGNRLISSQHTAYGAAVVTHPELRVGEGATGMVAAEGRPRVMTDIQADPLPFPSFKQIAAAQGLQSQILMPIQGHTGVVGVMTIFSQQRRQFTSDEIDVLTAHAEQAAIAITQSQLLADVTERTAELERSNNALHEEIAVRQQIEAEREQLITQLESQNAELERFTYTVSHDLKSPLITMQGFLGMLEKDIRDGNSERLQQDIHYIQKAATTMQQLLQDLLELSRIGRIINPPMDVSLGDIVQEALGLVQGAVTTQGVQVDVLPDLPVVWCDRPRLLEVFQNLLDNAIKFMGDQPSPRIVVGVRWQETEPVCYVQDNGMGIAPSYHNKVFGLFERLSADTEGTGIGLALVKRIIEVHGGRIWVESAGHGRGSTFCFTLPRPADSLAAV